MMAEVLSQYEIDRLLSAISTGEMDAEQLKEEAEPKVQVYDFKRALRMSKEQIRTLSRISESYARLLTSYLSSRLRALVEVKLLNVDQLPYEEFLRSIPEQTFLVLFQAPPLEGTMALEVSPTVCYAMLENILGGLGDGHVKGNFTEIDTMLLEDLFFDSMGSFRDAWRTLADLEPRMTALEFNPQFMQLASANDTVLLISFSVELAQTKGLVNLCIPHMSLEPVAERLFAQFFYTGQKGVLSDEDREPMRMHLMNTYLPVSVELGQTVLTFQELLNLSEGDVISLNQHIESPLVVKVNQEKRFLGVPGTIRQHMGVKIVEVLPSGGEQNE